MHLMTASTQPLTTPPAAEHTVGTLASTDHIIAATNVVKTYHTGKITVNALRGVHFSVERGDMVAIMGPSGCGKTTLLNCLSGLDTIDDGQILIDGTDLAVLPDNARTEYRAHNIFS